MKEKIEFIEPHLPDDFKMILNQLGKIVEIYCELIKMWSHPPIIYRGGEPSIQIKVK